MAQINTELKTKGYLPVSPKSLYKAVPDRKPGYLEAFTASAILSDGMFYIKREDFYKIRETYGNSDKPLPAPKSEAYVRKTLLMQQKAYEPAKADITDQSQEDSEFEQDLKKFLDETQECDIEKWQEARSAYLEEVRNRKTAGCSTCQLNTIKQKYRNLLKNL